MEPDEDTTPDRDDSPQPDPHRSGLRDPARAISALGAVVLAMEALVLLLALVPLRMLRIPELGWASAAVVTLTLCAIVLACLMRHAWAWRAGLALQVVLVLCGFFHWALAAVGVIFGLTWWYALSVRAKLSRPPQR